jgi:hypothetical protein
LPITGARLGEVHGRRRTYILAIAGLGYGAPFSGVLAHLTESVEDRYAPDISGLFNTTLQVGGTVGMAVFGTVYLDGDEVDGRARVPTKAPP